MSILTQAKTLTQWQIADDEASLSRVFELSDFKSAFAFMTQLAMYAEEHHHHPEWSNVYNRVHIRLTTHDTGGISVRDIAFARYADAVFSSYSRSV